MKIDQAAYAIHLYSRFSVKSLGYKRFAAKEACGCTEDCGGAGILEFETGALQDGVYAVYLGETQLGSLSIPLKQDTLFCLHPDRPEQGAVTPPVAYPAPTDMALTPYPAPISTLPAAAMPYPEPGASMPATLAPMAANPIAVAVRTEPVWYSPVITVALPISLTESIVTGEWISSTRLYFETQSARSSGSFWADLDMGIPVVSILQPADSPHLAYSASSLYSVQCGRPLQMIDVANQTVISQANIILNPNAPAACDFYVSWAGNQLAAFTGCVDGNWGTYLWRPDGSMPFRIGSGLVGARAPVWSPNFQQVAFLNFSDGPTHEMQLAIANQKGELTLALPAKGASTTSATILWLSPQVIALSTGEAGWQFYMVPDGELLFIWSQIPGIVLNQYNEFPALSPDGRWFLIERNGSNSNAVLHKTYSLYDVQKRQEIPLYDRPWQGLKLSGWSPNGEILYVLHIPLGPDAGPDADLPYGLLAYHLTEGRFETLVENAQSVSWDAGYQRALAYIFFQGDTGQATLSAGIWDIDRKQVTGAYPITNSPTQYDFLLHPASLDRFVPAAWSPDGQQVAFFNWGGELILMDLDGQTQRLASQVGLGRSDFTRLLAWSPDGSRLFVSDRGTAWIVTVPAVGHWREMRYERSDWSIALWKELSETYETALFHKDIPGCILAPAYGHGLQGTDLTIIHERSNTSGTMFNYTTIADAAGNPLYSNIAVGYEFIGVQYSSERKADCMREAEKVFLTYRDGDRMPSDRGAGYAYDRANNHLLAFGGYREGNYLPAAQTWAYDSQGWRQLQPSSAPGERAGAGLAYDAGRQEIVLFGGGQLRDAGNGLEGISLQDTWIWDGANWVEQHPANSPLARGGALMVYDAARQGVLLFGGIRMEGEGGRETHFLSDTWFWDGATWSEQDSGELSNGAIPQPSMVYDAAHQNVVLWQYTTGAWIWDGQSWYQPNPQHSPDPYLEGLLGYDETRGQVIFWGFKDTVQDWISETWAWNGQDWSLIKTGDNPGPRHIMNSPKVMFFDVSQKALVLIVRTGDKFSDELSVWKWTGSGWERID